MSNANISGLAAGVSKHAQAKSFATRRFQKVLLLIQDGPPLRQHQIEKLHAALDQVPVLPD